MIISKGKKWNRRENDRRTSSFCRNGRIDFGEALDDGEDSFDDLVFPSRRFHSSPVAWKWERRRLEVPKTIRDPFISQTLSLSKNLNENQKSSKLELSFCWKLIGVSDEGWSRGARTRSGARIWAWKGISIWGVLMSWGFWRFGGFEVFIWRLKLEVLRKFKFAGVFIQVAIHDLGVFIFRNPWARTKWLVAHEGIELLFFSCLFWRYLWPLK